jgi:ribonuclease Z
MDTHHTPHYAAGYLIQQINPRIGMATHLEYEPTLSTEVVAGCPFTGVRDLVI